jgi:hypothetical protein
MFDRLKGLKNLIKHENYFNDFSFLLNSEKVKEIAENRIEKFNI